MEDNTPNLTDETIVSKKTKKTATSVVKRKSNTPADDVNFAAVALRVAQNWGNYPQITLINYNQVDFLATTTQFNGLIQQRLAEQQIRPTLTRTTKDLNNDIKMGVRVVRNYLFEKYKSENIARSYYTDFGIEYKNTTWKFPTDQQYILIALNKAKAGVITHGFGNKDYGTAFWTALETNYTAIVQTAITSDGSSSTTVFQKNTLKKEIQTVMTALRSVIRGNYGAGANAVMRDLGFQKEKA